MRALILAAALSCLPGFVNAEEIVVTTTVSTAQQDADQMARTGILRHCGRAGGRREGIGFSTSSPEAACKACCYSGRYKVVERGVAYSHVRRGWFAVQRYGN